MRKYFKILNLEVRHDDQPYTGLSFELLERSQKLCADYRLQVKYSPAGLSIYAPIIETDGNKSFFIPIEESISLRWLVKAHNTPFFDQTQLPPVEGLYYISNDPGDGNRFNKFKYSVYGGLDKPHTRTEFLFGYVSRYREQICQLEAGATKIVLNPPPVAGAKVKDCTSIPAFPDSQEDIAFRAKNAEVVESTLKIKKIKSDSTVLVRYPVPVRAFSDSFLVLELVLDPSEEDENKNRISLEETLTYHLLFRKKKDKK